jgi:pimeloyl-ACP methyl ester carboxylesterase
MQFHRTPDEHFTTLANYPFAPNYAQIPDGEGSELRLHYLDEGPADGPVVLLLHRQPSWSYLYRFMVPALVESGFRVLAPDLIGFGRSDKPTRVEDYTYAAHITWMSEWLNAMGISDITLFCQHWGSLIGLRLVAAFPGRFSHVVPEVEENNAAWEVLRQFDKPFMTAFSDSDPVTAGAEGAFQQEIPDARGVAHRTIPNAGHFLQQEQPDLCVQAILHVTGHS